MEHICKISTNEVWFSNSNYLPQKAVNVSMYLWYNPVIHLSVT